ncbi:MAG: matrixin family metalloprotease [Deltaproteobacteria bacterium]|nr:matrixin family metalloprotease [Deltaproteobacteria bacterium]
MLFELKHSFVLALLVLVSACGVAPEKKAPWPASVRLENLTDVEQSRITQSLKQISTTLGIELFNFDSRPSQFQLTITRMTPEGRNVSQAGVATYNGTFCKVELNELVLQSSYSSYFEPVLWHEIGHCSGMEHVENSKEIMYPFANPRSFYSETSISSFFQSLLNYTSLTK